jgi:hypothetical protein
VCVCVCGGGVSLVIVIPAWTVTKQPTLCRTLFKSRVAMSAVRAADPRFSIWGQENPGRSPMPRTCLQMQQGEMDSTSVVLSEFREWEW